MAKRKKASSKKSSSKKTTKATKKSTKQDDSNAKLCAALSYVLIGIIWYFVDENMKKNSFANYHAKQGIVLLLTSVVFNVVGAVPIIGWAIAPILNLIVLIWVIIGIVNAVSHREAPLFIIGKWAEDWNL